MFPKLSMLALVLPLVSALTINPPSNWQIPGAVTLSFSGSSTDPQSFSVELVNAANFHNTYALANNVLLAQGSVTIQLPQISPGSYSIELINPSNLNQVYAEYGPFDITAASTTSSPSSTTTSSSSSITMSTMSSASEMTTTSLPSFSLSTPAVTGTSSAPSTSPTTFNSSAASFKLAGIAPAVALVLSAVAGAAMVF